MIAQTKTVERNSDGSITIEASGAVVDYSLVWMHGLGGSAEDFVELFGGDKSPVGINTRVVLLTAPQRSVTGMGGKVIKSWYDIGVMPESVSTSSFEDLQGVSPDVQKVVEREAEKLGNKLDRVFIGGFSQGGVVALFNGLHYGTKLAGIICLSGYLLPEIEIPDHHSKILLTHGQLDKAIPEEKSRATFERSGFLSSSSVEYHSVADLSHTYTPEVVSLVSGFIKKCTIYK